MGTETFENSCSTCGRVHDYFASCTEAVDMGIEAMNDKEVNLRRCFDRVFFLDDEGNWSDDGSLWKRPCSVVVPAAEADKFNEALDWFVGGHEEPVPVKVPGATSKFVQVRSKGYYHYIGA